MYIQIIALLGIFALQGTSGKRCQLSSNFQRYCGEKKDYFDLTPEQCRDRCDGDTNCLVGHWHPPRQIWATENRPVCFLFRANDKRLKVCPWGNSALIGAHPGARMIRCSTRENTEIERCTTSTHFQRHCGDPVRVTYDESMERCRQQCNDMTTCHVAHWHPPRQIWNDVNVPVCWMFPVGTNVCAWNGGELIQTHPGAQMFRCRQPTIRSFSYDINAIAMLSETPQVLGRIVITNHCPKVFLHRCPDQKKTLVVSKTTSSSKSWEHTAGVSVTAGVKFESGIPFVAKAEVSVSVTGSYSHTWGNTETEEKSWSVRDECVSGAGIKTTCEFFVTKKQIHVPFTIVWSTGEETRGMYRGVDFFYGGTTVTPEFLTTKRR